jgi:hypothetical protein
VSKINNYILLTIAEKSFELFQKTKYLTYTNFCKKIGISLQHGMLTNSEKLLLANIICDINLIYGLKDDEAIKYVNAFFMFDVEEIGEYEKYIRTMIRFYPFLFIDK